MYIVAITAQRVKANQKSELAKSSRSSRLALPSLLNTLERSMSWLEAVDRDVTLIRQRTDATPSVAMILGSGLGSFADTLESPVRIPYSDLEGCPVSTVKGHAGQFVVGMKHGVSVIAMQGRVHAYEGLPIERVVHPLRVMWRLGARSLVVTNAAGGLNPDHAPGTLMLITDHINLTGKNPLVGENVEEVGPRFPDMTTAYTPKLRALARKAAEKIELSLEEGVYVGNLGPTYETPAEVRMCRIIGGDAVGMSTVPEVIVASHLGMEVLGISCITNHAAGILDQPLDHSEVTEVATRVRARFIELLDTVFELGAARFKG